MGCAVLPIRSLRPQSGGQAKVRGGRGGTLGWKTQERSKKEVCRTETATVTMLTDLNMLPLLSVKIEPLLANRQEMGGGEREMAFRHIIIIYASFPIY